jgi:hypothetical protein
MKKPKIPPQVTDVLFELGIELLKTLQDLNKKGKLTIPRKSKTKKGVTIENTTDIAERVRP